MGGEKMVLYVKYMFKFNNRNTRLRRYLWTYLTPCSNVSIVNFGKVNPDWLNNFRNTLTQNTSTKKNIKIYLVLLDLILLSVDLSEILPVYFC